MDEIRWQEWERAQDHEVRLWARKKASKAGAQTWWQKHWEKANLGISENDKVVEIGGGPLPMLSESPVIPCRRVVIEPLAEEYREVGYELDNSLEWISLPIEKAEIGEGGFTHAITINCLDHVADVSSSIKRISQLLEFNGKLFISMHIKTLPYLILDRIIPKRFHPDPCHPSPMSFRKLVRLLEENGFRIEKTEFWWPKPASMKTRIFNKNLLVWARKIDNGAQTVC